LLSTFTQRITNLLMRRWARVPRRRKRRRRRKRMQKQSEELIDNERTVEL
jgi:hypothetical protein